MKYRGVRYTIRMRIQREEWYVAIHPDGAELPGKVVAGSREDAELQVQSMIDAWLRKRGVQIPKRRQLQVRVGSDSKCASSTGVAFWTSETVHTLADATMTVTPRMVAFTLIGTLAYLGLAVLGWGGLAAFLSHPALIALAILTFVMSGAALFSGANLSAGIREDRSNRWVIGALAFIGLVAGYLPAYTDRIGFWTLDGDTIRWVGVVLFAAGGALRIWPVFVLGHRFSGLVAIQPEHSLVTSGVYGLIRHPSYLGLLVNSLGWALAFRSVIGILLTAFTVPPLLARIRAEETLLKSQFGDEYEVYRTRTSRLIPWLY